MRKVGGIIIERALAWRFFYRTDQEMDQKVILRKTLRTKIFFRNFSGTVPPKSLCKGVRPIFWRLYYNTTLKIGIFWDWNLILHCVVHLKKTNKINCQVLHTRDQHNTKYTDQQSVSTRTHVIECRHCYEKDRPYGQSEGYRCSILYKYQQKFGNTNFNSGL